MLTSHNPFGNNALVNCIKINVVLCFSVALPAKSLKCKTGVVVS